MSEPQSVRRQMDLQQHQGVVQSDLATNLFAVFLAILASLQIIATASTMSGYKLRLTPERHEPAQQLGLVRSWHPVLPINKKVLIRNNRAIGLNLTPIARSFATGVSLFAENDDISDYSRPLRSDRAPSAFVFMLHLDPAITFPHELVAWSVEIAADARPELPEEVQHWVDTAQSVDIYVSVGQEENAWQLAAYLSESNIPLRIQTLNGETAFSFSRRTKYYGFEGVYK